MISTNASNDVAAGDAVVAAPCCDASANGGIEPCTPANAPRAAIHTLLDRDISETELQENTRWVSQPALATKRCDRRILLFMVSGELLAVPATGVSRVIAPIPVARIPHRSNSVVRGLGSVGGELVLVADLANLLQLPPPVETSRPEATKRRRMIVVGPERDRWAFQVDDSLGVDSFDQSTFLSPPITIEQAVVHYADAIVPVSRDERGDRYATLLDIQSLISNLRRLLS